MTASSDTKPFIGPDDFPALQAYAHPEKLVTNDWLGAHLGLKHLKVVESNEDSLLYDIGHIPTAVRIDWAADLGDPLQRDFIDGQAFADLMNAKGISRDDTVVIYGDQANQWATYTLWVFELFGHPDVRLLDGGRNAWMQEEKEITYTPGNTAPPAVPYPVVERNDAVDRIFVSELTELISDATQPAQIIDLRDPDQYTGEDTSTPGPDNPCGDAKKENVATYRHGHIPSALNLSTKSALLPNSRFQDRRTLEALHQDLDPAVPTVAYCSNGSRAAQEWFILRFLLGWDGVRLYDGSWGEWGNMIRMPIAKGVKPVE